MAALDSPVVSTQWLADHLGDDAIVVLDATVLSYTQPNGRSGYLTGDESYLLNGHIPGALFADLIETLSDPEAPYPFTHQSADAFAAAVGALGIDNQTSVVVYDAVVGQWAARVWWLFRTFGYDSVAVLDGGLTKWLAEERPTEVGHVEATPAVFVATERPELWVTQEDVQAVLAGTASAALVCGVPPQQFAEKGHIPGSINVPAGRLVDRVTNEFLAPDALRAAFAPVLSDERIIAYCNGGIAAASDALALTLLGHRNVALYDGSLNEWGGELVTAG